MYERIDFTKVKGFNQLSAPAKNLFEAVYKRHNAGLGSEYKKEYKPVKVKEHTSYIEVHFSNGEWLHYYPNGTWG